MVAARCRGNLGRLFERYQWLPRHTRGCVRRNGQRSQRASRRRKYRRRHGNDLFRIQGRNWHASRQLSAKLGGYTVGVLVQCNFGSRHLLRIAGVPVGQEIPGTPIWSLHGNPAVEDRGSIIVVVATDAPLLPTQLNRVARRVTLGLGRLGSISGDGSGDIFIAFSTANPGAGLAQKPSQVTMMPNGYMDPLFEATVQAVEEAVVNAMVAAKTMTGIDNRTVEALPHDRLHELLKKYNRLPSTQ